MAVQSTAEEERVLGSCHSDEHDRSISSLCKLLCTILIHSHTSGGHFEKISNHFYWPRLAEDVRKLVQTCEMCQRTNDGKFCKAVAPLHPIAVQPKNGTT